MKFLNDFKKDLDKIGLEEGASAPPAYWYSTGNHVLNKIISGSFMNGVPQGRIMALVGPSGAGKSFVLCNILREAQQRGAYIVVLDSENALDDDFVAKIGVDTENNYTYIGVTTIPEASKVVSSFISGYKKEYGDDPEAPEVVIAIDSLDMLITETEEENFSKGVTKGDQGQKNKQLKAMLRQFVQATKNKNISMVVTDQVYKNQDVMNGEGVWMVKDAVKFSLSQIIMLTKLKLRGEGREIDGIRMKCEGYKTRFTKPFQTVTIEVPYEQGMDPYNGLLKVAADDLGVVEKKGSWYTFKDTKFQEKNLTPELAQDILVACEAKREMFLDAMIAPTEEDTSAQPSGKKRREDRYLQKDNNE